MIMCVWVMHALSACVNVLLHTVGAIEIVLDREVSTFCMQGNVTEVLHLICSSRTSTLCGRAFCVCVCVRACVCVCVCVCGWVGGWVGGCGWVWVGVDGCGWVRVGVGGCGWVWVGVGGCGWVWVGVGVGGCGWVWVGVGGCGWGWRGDVRRVIHEDVQSIFSMGPKITSPHQSPVHTTHRTTVP